MPMRGGFFAQKKAIVPLSAQSWQVWVSTCKGAQADNLRGAGNGPSAVHLVSEK